MILRIRLYGCESKQLYDTILCSQYLWAMKLILQQNGKQYQIWRIFHVRISKAHHQHYTAGLPMNSINLNIGDFAS